MSGDKLACFESYAECPYFPEGLVERRVKVGYVEKDMHDPDTKYYEGRVKVPKYEQRWHDSKVFVKVFTHHIPELTMELSPPASKMLWYVILNLPLGGNWIKIAVRDFLKYAGYGGKSLAVYYRAITELIRAGILARRTGEEMTYWINVNFIFNGDRTRLVPPPLTKENDKKT